MTSPPEAPETTPQDIMREFSELGFRQQMSLVTRLIISYLHMQTLTPRDTAWEQAIGRVHDANYRIVSASALFLMVEGDRYDELKDGIISILLGRQAYK